MKINYFKPFVEGVTELLADMIGVTCETTEEQTTKSNSYLSGTITLSGASEGQVCLSLPRKSAYNLVSKMLNMDESEINDEILMDAVGEMANIVAGNAKTKLAATKYKFSISVPTIVMGENHRTSMFHGQKENVACFKTEYGSFELAMWITLNPS
jgi:chemotaxis protein CheX